MGVGGWVGAAVGLAGTDVALGCAVAVGGAAVGDGLGAALAWVGVALGCAFGVGVWVGVGVWAAKTAAVGKPTSTAEARATDRIQARIKWVVSEPVVRRSAEKKLTPLATARANLGWPLGLR